MTNGNSFKLDAETGVHYAPFTVSVPGTALDCGPYTYSLSPDYPGLVYVDSVGKRIVFDTTLSNIPVSLPDPETITFTVSANAYPSL